MELKHRKDMDPAYQWDFTHIYPDHAAWEAAMAEAAEGLKAVSAVRGTLGASPEALKQGLDTVYAVSQKLELSMIYAMLHHSADGGDSSYQEMNARASDLAAAFNAAASFLNPELLAIDEETLRSWLEREELKTYRHTVEDICRARAHTLDASTENLLANLRRAASAPSDAFNMMQAVDMVFPEIQDENGNTVRLTNGNFGVYRESADPRVRKDAFEAYFGAFEQYKNTLCALYSGSVKYDNFSAKTRGYEGACQASLFQSNVPVSVYDSLIEAVHESLPAMKRYLALRQKILGLDTLNLWDLYCPIVEEVDYKVPFEDAKALVKEAPVAEPAEEAAEVALEAPAQDQE